MTGTIHSYEILQAIGLITLMMTIEGCAHSETLRTEGIPANADEEILIFIAEGRVIKFHPGEYRIIKSDSGSLLQGQGREFNDVKRNQSSRFAGSIPLARIDSVQVKRYSALSDTAGWTLAIAGGTVVLISLLVWVFHFHFTAG